MNRLAALAVGIVALASGIGCASAATREYPDALAGRLQHIKESRVVQLGYRENAIPFSYAGRDGTPVGYSLEICQAIVTTMAEDLDIPDLRIDYVRVTAQNRLARVASGAVDLECGSTTNTLLRRQEVAFSPVIFVTGTRIVVPRGGHVHDVADLRGKTLAVVRGTTNEAAMREVNRLRGLEMKFLVADDYRDALEMLASLKADALAADDILLRGLLAETGRVRDFRFVGDLLSFEPYGIVYARDDRALADVVERTLRRLAETREILWIYDRWFTRPLPSGGRIDLPMGAQLRRSLELIGLPPD
jgi:glutamate/aspartate transport system substrate-binding protein